MNLSFNKHSFTVYEKDYSHSLAHAPCYSHQCQSVWVYTAGPDQGPNGLPGLSADDKSYREQQSDQRLCYSHQCQTVNRQNVDPDWGSNCLPRLSTDDKSRSEQGIIDIG